MHVFKVHLEFGLEIWNILYICTNVSALSSLIALLDLYKFSKYIWTSAMKYEKCIFGGRVYASFLMVSSSFPLDTVGRNLVTELPLELKHCKFPVYYVDYIL